MIEMDVAARALNLLVPADELERRRKAWKPRPAPYTRGFGEMFLERITQADRGCDFDFLEGVAPTPEPEIH